MPVKSWLLAGILCLLASTAAASTTESAKVVRVYGPGGPHHVLEECAEMFREREGINVVVIRAFPHDLEQKLREDGDIYYGGAEYMMEEFDRRNPGVLNLTSAENLHGRRIGIIVRKGNPLAIQGVEDLGREEIDLLDVKLENMGHLNGLLDGGIGNVRKFAYTGQQGASAWMATPELDAWVTYKSWHVWLGEHSEFIEIPGDHALRFTPMALTNRTPHREEALAFLGFLKSDEARQVFEEHGWE